MNTELGCCVQYYLQAQQRQAECVTKCLSKIPITNGLARKQFSNSKSSKSSAARSIDRSGSQDLGMMVVGQSGFRVAELWGGKRFKTSGTWNSGRMVIPHRAFWAEGWLWSIVSTRWEPFTPAVWEGAKSVFVLIGVERDILKSWPESWSSSCDYRHCCSSWLLVGSASSAKLLPEVDTPQHMQSITTLDSDSSELAQTPAMEQAGIRPGQATAAVKLFRAKVSLRFIELK